MHIKKKFSYQLSAISYQPSAFKFVFSAFLFQLLTISIILLETKSSTAQIVWEDPKNSIHQFLSRQAQKGNIEITDFILPLSRKEIAADLAILKDSVHKLSATEQKELDFYLREYSEFSGRPDDTTTFLKKDPAGRWRFLSVDTRDFLVRGDPVISLETIQGREKSIIKNAAGIRFWGHVGKRFAFQAYFADITETGKGIDTVKQFTNETGIVRTANVNPDAKTLNYTELRGNLAYNWNNGSVSFGNDQLLYGYGENGRIISSDKAPAYPFLRLDYQPLKWFRFHYAHSWLQSGIVDSNKSYPKGNTIYGDEREIYRPKFMATHSFNFFPLKGLALSIGESMVYSDRLDVGYLIPVMFFKAYDQYASRYKINSGSNGQFFLHASSRNHIQRTHLYGGLFIDEIRLSEVFNKAKSRNQIGFNLGASVTDVLIPYLTLGIEYTRINPFVYQNLIPAQTYSHQNYTLGDWIGQNADRTTAWVKYNPMPRLTTSIQLNYTRKGEDGSLENQYYAEPQPKFLAGNVTTQKQMLIEVKYEIINQLRVRGSYLKQAGIIRPAMQPKAVANEIRLGISYGF
ncbi:capsule assembly Wzi family protein [Daejeonella lutea]|uniref:Capsule assembly protein Wzi n=1 Tax=Daejeonella lutea TaxID=572036 RepID=A0A1T5FAH1_9SPHI|nr:capsule assembly Wzi family protein [Daejeonella lutea]SKB93144.1 Capsule assembly protein Wzi [Daejeonella lutea]